MAFENVLKVKSVELWPVRDSGLLVSFGLLLFLIHVPTSRKFIIKRKLILAGCPQLELHNTKSFINWNKTVKENAWSKIRENYSVPPLIRVSQFALSHIRRFFSSHILQFLTKTHLKTHTWDFFTTEEGAAEEEGSGDEQHAGRSASLPAPEEYFPAISIDSWFGTIKGSCPCMEKWPQLTQKRPEKILIRWGR